MKKILVVAVSVLAVLILLSFAKDLIIKVSVEKGMELVTGLKLEMKGFSAGIIKSVVSIKDLKLFNPKDFPDPVMIDMPEIYVDYDLPAIIAGKVHLREMRIDLKEFTVVKNRNGALNLDSLKVVKAEKQGKASSAKEGGMPPIQIDKLHLRIGKAIYKDYSKGPTPSVQEFNVNIDETYTDINNPYSLVGLIVVKTLSNTAISNLANFDIGGLSDTVSNTLSSATDIASKISGSAGETVRKTSAVVEGAGDAVTKAAEGLKDIFGTLK